MMLNRIQTISPILHQNQFNFATKSLKLVKMRMKAVQSIKKITKAMKMVAASKMKADVARLQKAKTFGVGSIDKILSHQTYVQKKKTPVTVKKSLLVPFTSDKGLCGGTNSNIVRLIKATVKNNRSEYKIFPIGDKGSVALARPLPDLMEGALTHITNPINFPTAAAIGNQILRQGKQCQKIILVYNQFKNVITQIQRKAEIMTLEQFLNTFKYVVRHDSQESQMTPTANFFYEFYLGCTIYHALLHNIASQQSARMNAMQNASKNAGQILESLTLDYNKARQAKITMQLCEIISGASAV